MENYQQPKLYPTYKQTPFLFYMLIQPWISSTNLHEREIAHA